MLKPVILNAKPVCDAQNHSTSRSSPLRERRGGIGHVTAQLAAARGTRLMLVSSDRPRRGDSYGHFSLLGRAVRSARTRRPSIRRHEHRECGRNDCAPSLHRRLSRRTQARHAGIREPPVKGSLALTYVARGLRSRGLAAAASRRWHRCFRASLEGWNRCSGRTSCADNEWSPVPWLRNALPLKDFR